MATIERVDAHVLMAHVLGVNRAYLAANPMRVLTESEDGRVDMLVTRRARPAGRLPRREARVLRGRDFAVGPEVHDPAARDRRPWWRPRLSACPRTCPRRCPTLVRRPGHRQRRARRNPRLRASQRRGDRHGRQRGRPRGSSRGNAAANARAAWSSCAAPGTRAARKGGVDLIVANPPYVAAGTRTSPKATCASSRRARSPTAAARRLDLIRAIVAGASDHLNARGWLLARARLRPGAAGRGAAARRGFPRNRLHSRPRRNPRGSPGIKT